jgi:hypothetical protein
MDVRLFVGTLLVLQERFLTCIHLSGVTRAFAPVQVDEVTGYLLQAPAAFVLSGQTRDAAALPECLQQIFPILLILMRLLPAGVCVIQFQRDLLIFPVALAALESLS